MAACWKFYRGNKKKQEVIQFLYTVKYSTVNTSILVNAMLLQRDDFKPYIPLMICSVLFQINQWRAHGQAHAAVIAA